MVTKLKKKLSITNTLLIWKARNNIQHIITETPLISSMILSDKMSEEVCLKLENLGNVGVFKVVRGAADKIISLTEEEKKHEWLHFRLAIMDSLLCQTTWKRTRAL